MWLYCKLFIFLRLKKTLLIFLVEYTWPIDGCNRMPHKGAITGRRITESMGHGVPIKNGIPSTIHIPLWIGRPKGRVGAKVEAQARLSSEAEVMESGVGRRRVRIRFEDRTLLSHSQISHGLRRCWLLFQPSHLLTISDLASHLLDKFSLHRSCPDGLLLYVSTSSFPPFVRHLLALRVYSCGDGY